MILDLQPIKEIAEIAGLNARFSNANCLEIYLAPNIVFRFENDIEKNDNLAYFRDTSWHFHDSLHLLGNNGTLVEYKDIDILQGIIEGEILLCEQYRHGNLLDRWLNHKSDKGDNQDISE